MKEINEFFVWAKSNNWQLELSTDKKQFPSEILQRYINIPNEYKIFYAQIDLCANQSNTTWFFSENDFLEANGENAFAWNSFEKMSLEALADDDVALQEITEFWNLHLPVMYCVGGDYEHYAINITTGAIVNGYQPEFEDVTEVATSFCDFLDKIIKGEIAV